MKPWQKWSLPLLLVALVPLMGPAPAHGAPTPEDPSPDAAAVPLPAPAATDPSAQFDRELLSVEEEVNSLKERVFRSKATLQLLSEIVAQGAGAGSRIRILHDNRLGAAYQVDSVAHYLDGQPRFTRSAAEGGLQDLDDAVVYEGTVSPGTHKLSVTMKLRGKSGVFSYVDEIEMNVQSDTSFVVEEGAQCTVTVTSDDKGGMTRAFTERPQILFEARCGRAADDAAGD